MPLGNQNAKINHELAVLAFTAQGAGSGVSSDFENSYSEGVKLFINMGAGAGTLTISIDQKDPVSGLYKSILTSTALASASGLTVMAVFPGSVAAANLIANDFLPRSWRVSWTIATGAVTATVTAAMKVIQGT